MAAYAPELPLAVAYSGGADSSALLHACAARWPGQVRAIHVHHGLQAAANEFQRHCEATCAALNLPLQVCRVDARHNPGDSPEDAARIARYEAIRAAALEKKARSTTKSIALAQHADDQVETVVLALSRGAGLPGLAGMRAHWARDGIAYARPLLAVPGADIRRWLQQHGIGFVQDPSNADQRFTRNRIRARLLPPLEHAFPQFRTSFARSAAHAAQAQQLLDEVARQDLEQMGDIPVIAALQPLSQPRQANVLRHWLKSRHQAVPSQAQMSELLAQIAACATRGHDIHIKVAQGFVRREGPGLAWYNP